MIENYLDFFGECQLFIFQCCWCFSFPLFAGKSSQIPQFLLEENMTPILCTLPRRFAVVSVAKMVAKARNCQLGEEVGYHIGHSRHLSARYFKHIHLNWFIFFFRQNCVIVVWWLPSSYPWSRFLVPFVNVKSWHILWRVNFDLKLLERPLPWPILLRVNLI
jgi:hypothetical protein